MLKSKIVDPLKLHPEGDILLITDPVIKDELTVILCLIRSEKLLKETVFASLGPWRSASTIYRYFVAGMGLKPGRKIVPFLLKKKHQQTTFCPKRQMRSRVRSPALFIGWRPFIWPFQRNMRRKKTFLSFLLLGANSTMTSQLVNLIYKRFHFILGIHRVRAQSETRLSST